MTTLLALIRRPDGGPEPLAMLLILEDLPEMLAAATQPVDTVETTSEDPS